MTDPLSKIWLDNNHMQCLFELYHQEPVVRIAREVIGNTLFSSGLEVTKAGGKRASADFDRLIRRYWTPFCSSVLDHIYMFGFCPYRKIKVKIGAGGKDNNGTAEIPIVPPMGSYRVEMRLHRDFTQTYHFYPVTRFPNVNDKEDTRVRCLVVDRFKPSIDGVIRSPMATLLHSFRVSRELFEYAIHAEHLRSHPTLITQSQPQRGSGEADAVEMFEFADGDAFANRDEANYAKNRARMQDLARQQNMAAVLNGKHVRDRDTMIDPLTGNVIKKTVHKQTWENNVFALPDGQALAPHLNPQSRNDLMDIERNRHDLICGVMGVPRSLIMSERASSASTGASDITYRMFIKTLHGIEYDLATLLGEVFEHVYGEADCEFSFPFLPITSMEDLATLSQHGITSRKKIGSYMLRSMGLPESDIDLQPLFIEPELEKTSAAVRPAKKARKS